MVKIPKLDLGLLQELVRGQIHRVNKKDICVTSLAEPREADNTSVCFVISEGFVKEAKFTKAAVLVVQEEYLSKVLEQDPSSSVQVYISSQEAYYGFACLTEWVVNHNPYFDWDPITQGTSFIHPTAKIDPTAKIHPHVMIGPEVSVGAHTVLFPGVVLYPRTIIGNRVRIHANAVLGMDGFGYARSTAGAKKIWHLGRVVVQDDVEIGAGTTIDRGTIKDTIVETGVKIDNLVQIGHNCHLKASAIVCAQVGLAGNVTIGQGAILAGKVGIADKVTVGDGAMVGAMSGLSKDVPEGSQVMGGQPARSRRQWWKLLACLDKLPELFDRVKKLERNSGILKKANPVQDEKRPI